MMHYTLQMMEKEEAHKRRELRNLYEELAYMRDQCIEMRDRIKCPESKQQYDGRATAYDTVRGMLFAIIGEDDESEVHE